MLGSASADGDYADIYAPGWIEFLRASLIDECRRIGLTDVNPQTLQHAPRPITQIASLRVYEHGFAGICYRSRFGLPVENWALFEPLQITPADSEAITASDPILKQALKILGLSMSSSDFNLPL
jgi:hypothetical protein